jgi:2-(1,2-epoxy-1,2-dihydrophenyl)acetyl-CoA isomerase
MPDRLIDTGTDVMLIEVTDQVGVITLNRPDRRNALHREMYEPISRALAEFADADDVGCIVLTGAGTGFCAGGDVRDGRRREPGTPSPTVAAATASLLADAQIARLFHESPKLTIAAVNGPAVGAGLSLALACDLRIMAASATLIPAWSRLAFSGDFGGAWFLTRLVGPSRALEILVENRTVTADEALALGLANRVADVATFPAAMKANVQQALVVPLAAALADESERMVRSGRTAAHREGVRAWIDKREPDFGAIDRSGKTDAR